MSIWLFSKQRSHELTIVFLWFFSFAAFLPLIIFTIVIFTLCIYVLHIVNARESDQTNIVALQLSRKLFLVLR